MISQFKHLYKRYLDRKVTPEQFSEIRRGLADMTDDDLWTVMLDAHDDMPSDIAMPDDVKTGMLRRLHRMIMMRRIWRVSRYAAAVALVAGMGWGIYDIVHKEPQPQILTASVKPGSKSEIMLPDGTKVQLNGESSVLCDLGDQSGYRTVCLKGEAFFDVTKNPDRPFRVKAGDMVVEVLGTSFNVNAYDPEVIETSLISGQISLSGDSMSGKYLLHQGDKAVYRRSDGSVTVSNVDQHRDTGWLDEYLIFESEPLSAVIKKVERWYGVEIEMRTSSVGTDDLLSGSFRHENIHNVMESLSVQYKFNYEINKDRIVIY